MWFQSSFGIPAEGVYTGLVAVLLLIIIALLVAVYLIASRNIRLVDDNREITRDAIRGFQDVIAALNAVREQIQGSDNALMGKMNDDTKKIYEELVKTQKEVLGHLQYLRDRAR